MNSGVVRIAPTGGSSALAGNINGIYGKITWHIAPVLLIAYALSFMDRINIGFGQLQMKADLGFSDAVYGTGAAIFFVGYFFLEIPSNLLLHKVGARLTIFRIMLCWGAVSALTFLIQTAPQLYVARFLLGVFESGLYPGLILYLTYWYPPGDRAKMMAVIHWGAVIAGIVAGPVSGFIISNFDGAHGLRGWQWMFILEGVPSCVFAIYVFIVLADRPAKASWLTDAEKSAVIRHLQEQEPAVVGRPASFAEMLTSGRTWILAAIQFSVVCALYAGIFWMPSIIKASGATVIQTGVYAAIPFLVGGVAMWFAGRHSDAKRERRWYFVASSVTMVIGFLLLIGFEGNLPVSIFGLTMIISGDLVATTVFWPVAAASLTGTATAGGIALINCFSVLGGFVSPFALGYIKTSTGSLTYGLYAVIALLAVSSATMIALIPRDLER
jgi:sugar phosphate permease